MTAKTTKTTNLVNIAALLDLARADLCVTNPRLAALLESTVQSIQEGVLEVVLTVNHYDLDGTVDGTTKVPISLPALSEIMNRSTRLVLAPHNPEAIRTDEEVKAHADLTDALFNHSILD